MLLTTVESSTLAVVAYEASSQVLWLEFRSGTLYRYFDVPPAIHQNLIQAASKGAYFNRIIRGRFLYRREAHSFRQSPGSSSQP